MWSTKPSPMLNAVSIAAACGANAAPTARPSMSAAMPARAKNACGGGPTSFITSKPINIAAPHA